MMNYLKNLWQIALIAVLLVSCNQNNGLDDLNYTLNESGLLKVAINDVDGSPVKESKIYLYDFDVMTKLTDIHEPFSPELVAIKSGKSDNNGLIDFGKLNKGTYFIQGSFFNNEGKLFSIHQFVQIVAGETSQLTVNLKDYQGSVSLTIKGSDDRNSSSSATIYNPIDSINVALIPTSNSATNMSFNNLIKNGIALGKTDAKGNILANNIPLGTYYVVAFYNDTCFDVLSSDTFINSTSYLSISGRGTTERVYYAENSKLNLGQSTTNSQSTQFKVFYTEYNPNTGLLDTILVKNAKIIVSSSSSSLVYTAMANKIFEATTNSSGEAAINLSTYYSYYLWVYKNDDEYQQIGNYSITYTGTKINLVVSKQNFNKTYGSVKIKALGRLVSGITFDTIPLKNINLQLVLNNYSYFSTSNSGYTIRTDSLGNGYLPKIATGKYYLWAYSDDSHANRAIFMVDVAENKTTESTAIFDATQVMVLKADMRLEFYSTTNGIETKVKNAYVIASKYSLSGVEQALNYAVATGKTDNNGKVVLPNLEINVPYYIIVYYSLDKYATSYTSYTVTYKNNSTSRIQVPAAMLN